MKANELRLGNIIDITHWSYSDFQGELGVIGETITCMEKGYITAKGIPLTEEWLLKFGLNQFVKGFWQIDNGVDKFCLTFEDGGYHLSFMRYKNLKHIHQLQNLYFALTGEELTIKE